MTTLTGFTQTPGTTIPLQRVGRESGWPEATTDRHRARTVNGGSTLPNCTMLIPIFASGSQFARADKHIDGLATYPANLCPLFGRAEFAGFREDLGQSIGESVEAASRRAVGQGSTEHLDCVLSEEQRVNNAV